MAQEQTPKLDLRKNTRRLARLELVKQRAKVRTNQRIQMMLDERALKDAEQAPAKPEKKGDK